MAERIPPAAPLVSAEVLAIVQAEIARYAGLLADEMVRGPQPAPAGAAPAHQLYSNAWQRYMRGEVAPQPL